MSENDHISKAVDLATEKTRQMITLSTGIIALTISFKKDILGNVPVWTAALLLLSWLAYFASIICGVLLLGRIAASLQAEQLNFNTLQRTEIITSARWQKTFFLMGIGLSLGFAICATIISSL